MKIKANLKSVMRDWESGKYNVTFSIEEGNVEDFSNYKDKSLSVDIKHYRKARSRDANALLWGCIGDIQSSLESPTDKWEIYLGLLRRYGKYTYICVKPNVVEEVKRQWRESEVIGEVNINGEKAIQMICYFGSSTYDTAEFSKLLNGTIEEMRQMGIPSPPSAEMKRSLEEWEKSRSS